MSFLCGFRKDERQQVCRRVRFSASNSYGAYTDAGCFGKFWPKNVRHFFRTIWPQAMLQNENTITAFTFVASSLNSQNCCPEVPWTARCTIVRGRKAEGNGASSCPRYRGPVVLSIPPNSHEITVLLPNQC